MESESVEFAAPPAGCAFESAAPLTSPADVVTCCPGDCTASGVAGVAFSSLAPCTPLAVAVDVAFEGSEAGEVASVPWEPSVVPDVGAT